MSPATRPQDYSGAFPAAPGGGGFAQIARRQHTPARPELIKTERGLGYRFCASVAIVHSMRD
jgi:hypothetical protein